MEGSHYHCCAEANVWNVENNSVSGSCLWTDLFDKLVS